MSNYSIISILDQVIKSINSAFFYTPNIYSDSRSFLLSKPGKIIESSSDKYFFNALALIDDTRKHYDFSYGYLTYEAGYLFEEKLIKLYSKRTNKQKLLSFKFFTENSSLSIKSDKIDYSEIPGYLKAHKFVVRNFGLNVSESEFFECVGKIKKYIEEGDSYQVNYTLQDKFDFEGDIKSFLLQLLFNQSGRYIAIINEIDRFIISISPELFFHLKDGIIISKPMKGTMGRGYNYDTDTQAMNSLKNSIKDKSENIMIADLLRNDLGRICKLDSVKAEQLYEIEKYESVYQMISTISGKCKRNNFQEIFSNIFPCGSVTGAPKIRTMEIIHELEKHARGTYTGALGLILGEEMIFNVPIRTITIDKKTKKGQVGIGSGIVWDSDPLTEYSETKLKARFITNPDPYFELIETMLVENGKIFLFDYHLTRLKKSADFMRFKFDEDKFSQSLNEVISNHSTEKKIIIRCTLTKWGIINLSIDILNRPVETAILVMISDQKVSSTNKFQYFKTTNRKLYDNEYKKISKKGIFDVLYFNERDELAEGSITNIFLKYGDYYFTPKVSSGILNGCYRQFMISKEKNVIEKKLYLDDLLKAEEIILTNSVRKEIRVNKIIKNREIIYQK